MHLFLGGSFAASLPTFSYRPCPLLTLTSCGLKDDRPSAAEKGADTNQRIVVDNFRAPVANWALESDSAYILSLSGCLETLTKNGHDQPCTNNGREDSPGDNSGGQPAGAFPLGKRQYRDPCPCRLPGRDSQSFQSLHRAICSSLRESKTVLDPGPQRELLGRKGATRRGGGPLCHRWRYPRDSGTNCEADLPLSIPASAMSSLENAPEVPVLTADSPRSATLYMNNGPGSVQ